MQLTLPPELEKAVREKIERGEYESPEDLIQEAIHRLLNEEEADLDLIREKLRAADAEIDRGDCVNLGENEVQRLALEVSARGRKRLQERQPKSR